MQIEVGSDFYEYSILKDRSNVYFWTNSNYNAIYFKSGRNAIRGLCQLLSKCRKVLLPAFTCETVIKPFVDESWEISYYSIDTNLKIKLDSLTNLVQNFKPDVIFLQNYFGFSTVDECAIIDICKKNNIVIVEDITQSLLSNHHIEFCDYYVASFRKFFAIPDGGAIISKNKLNHLCLEDSDSQLGKIAFNAFELKKEYFVNPKPENKLLFREQYQLLNSKISQNDVLTKITDSSLDILFSIDKKEISLKRNKNYSTVLNLIFQCKQIKPILTCLNDDVTPLYFPFYCDNRIDLQKFLASNNIFCPIIWPKPPEIYSVDKSVDYIYDHILCLPIDQRYGIEEMTKIVNMLHIYEERRMSIG